MIRLAAALVVFVTVYALILPALTLEKKLANASSCKTEKEKAFYFKDEVFVAMAALRAPVDMLEMLVDKSVWPMPTYGDLIFEV